MLLHSQVTRWIKGKRNRLCGPLRRQNDEARWLGVDLSLLRAVVICVPEEPCSHTALHGGRLGVCAGPDWAQVSSIVTWTLMQSVQFSQPLFVPTSVQPIRYPHCSHPMPLVGWGSLTSAVLLVFKHQLRKSVLKVSLKIS